MDFYHDLAPFYDQMISFEERLDKEKEVFRSILDHYPAETVLDAGCGSGFHSILLAQLGKQVTGIDSSNEMLQLAEQNAQMYQVTPDFIKSDFKTIDKVVTEKFDAVYCLGNSFVHLLSEEDRYHVLVNFKNLIVPGGYLFLQIINYDKFLLEKREILSVKTAGAKTFTRSYHYQEQTITFIVTVKEGAKEQTISTELYPLREHEISNQLLNIGYNKIQKFGNLFLGPYEQHQSENLCLVTFL